MGRYRTSVQKKIQAFFLGANLLVNVNMKLIVSCVLSYFPKSLL